jgi:hypothetical protein
MEPMPHNQRTNIDQDVQVAYSTFCCIVFPSIHLHECFRIYFRIACEPLVHDPVDEHHQPQ